MLLALMLKLLRPESVAITLIVFVDIEVSCLLAAVFGGFLLCYGCGNHLIRIVASKMASPNKLWKLKASLRSTFGYKGELSQGGRVKPLFDNETPSALYTRRPVTDSATTPGGRSPLRHPFVLSFITKLISSSRTPAADHNPSTVYSSKHQALSPSEALSCLFFTPSIRTALLQSCRYSSLEGTRKLSGSSLREISETGLYLLTGLPLGGVFFQKERGNAPKHILNLGSSAPQDARKEQRLCDKRLTMDTDGIFHAEVVIHKTKWLSSMDCHRLIEKGIDGLCVENEDFESDEGVVGGIAHIHSMLLEKTTMQGLFGLQLLLNHSNAHYLFQYETSVCVVEDSHSKFTSNVRFSAKESPGLVFDGDHELHYAKDLSGNLDNKGVHGNLRLLSGACSLPHPKKVNTGGEDAFFICSEEQVVGVADGVGGWADVGVDAGDYARELMLQSRIAVAQEPHKYIDPARVMLRAHARTKCRGSSTACILALSDYGLQAANLGDSGFMLMRDGRTIFKSPVQQHQFNIPFQLESGGSDPPSAAEVFSLQVAAGDVLVAGTDGLFDNLYDSELMGVVIHSTRVGLDPQVTAQKIVALARERAEDRNRQTPFSTAAQEAGFRFYGGKMDDITVIVSYITTIKSGLLKPLSNL